MKNYISSLGLFLIFSFQCIAIKPHCIISSPDSCDNIVLRSGEEISGLVSEVGILEVKYKKCDNLSGPVYAIKKGDVFMIKYANGSKDIMPEEETKIDDGDYSSQKTKTQMYFVDDIFKTDEIYFFGYDFTNFKLIDPGKIDNGESMKTFIFDLISKMNVERMDQIKCAYFFKKDTVIYFQKSVNTLNEKTNWRNLLGTEKHSIPENSLQGMVNKYNTEGKSGIGLVEIMECFYKPKKQTTIWYVFFDMSSKKIIDTYETSNPDADSWHGLSEYWAVGVHSGFGFFLSDHYRKLQKEFLKNNK
jgi:hypothetical protein